MSIEEKNMELMKTLDDAWNSQDWDTFEERHADKVAVYLARSARSNKGST